MCVGIVDVEDGDCGEGAELLLVGAIEDEAAALEVLIHHVEVSVELLTLLLRPQHFDAQALVQNELHQCPGKLDVAHAVAFGRISKQRVHARQTDQIGGAVTAAQHGQEILGLRAAVVRRWK